MRNTRVYVRCPIGNAQVISGTSTNGEFKINAPVKYKKCRVIVEDMFIVNGGNLFQGADQTPYVHFCSNSLSTWNNFTNSATGDVSNSDVLETYFADPTLGIPYFVFKNNQLPKLGFLAHNVDLQNPIRFSFKYGDLSLVDAVDIPEWFATINFIEEPDTDEFLNAKPAPFVEMSGVQKSQLDVARKVKDGSVKVSY